MTFLPGNFSRANAKPPIVVIRPWPSTMAVVKMTEFRNASGVSRTAAVG